MVKEATEDVDTNNCVTQTVLNRVDGLKGLLGEISSSLEEIKKLHGEKKKGEKPSDNLLAALRQTNLQFLKLRETNRDIFQGASACRDVATAEKVDLDQHSLQLQNLLYEKHHVLSEIRACKNFRSKEKEVELVSEEDFIAKTGAKPDASNGHAFLLERFSNELEERKRLVEVKKELEMRKKAIADVNARKRKFLDSLPDKLVEIQKATQPLHQYLSLDTSKDYTTKSISQYLPVPLYAIFCEAFAYQDSFDNDISVEICGSVDEARAFHTTKLEDAAVESVAQGPSTPRKKSKRSKESVKKDDMYAQHPLTVVITLPAPKGPVKLEMSYLTRLELITVTLSDAPHVYQQHSLLINMIPNDLGRDSPNLAHNHLLEGKFKFNEKLPNRPYKWAQWIGGLDFVQHAPPTEDRISKIAKLSEIEQADPSERERRAVAFDFNCRPHEKFSRIIRMLKTRIGAREMLKTHVESLAKRQHPVPVTIAPPLSVKFSSWEDIKLSAFGQDLTSQKWEDEGSQCFRAVFECEGAKLEAKIKLKAGYPDEPPIFKLNHLKNPFKQKDFPELKAKANKAALELVTSATECDNNLAAMEQELSLYADELDKNPSTLAMLLRQLELMYAIYVVTEKKGTDGQSKVCLRLARGRDRKKPFVYNPALRLFDQR